ncbi:MAG TPA: arginine N-succinyltransferase [Polyangia bacterium]|jgi:arginine N-succinyltransferase|nr:arginine N-succinyltransferase [Polyangia bacterium]
MFVLRDVSADDLDDLHAAARHLDSVNLPDDRAYLTALIDLSSRSFAGEVDVAARRFVFVLVDEARGRVVGASSIFARHGTPRSPHIFFDVIEEQRYSETLDRHVAHRVLRIGYDYQGLTEIGGLVLLPEYRGHPEQLGRLLSYVRFLFIARHRAVFCKEVVSELMPPLEPDGTSLLWESLGRKFTGLTYQEADRLSHENKEFIRALFPQDPLYATLLPAHVQQLIGQVGPRTKGVEKMLREVGFEFAHRIDPFDGGPHFHAATDDITAVAAVRTARVAGDDPAAADVLRRTLVAREAAVAPRFRAVKALVPAPANDGTLAVPRAARRALGLATGDEVALLPM